MRALARVVVLVLLSAPAAPASDTSLEQAAASPRAEDGLVGRWEVSNRQSTLGDLTSLDKSLTFYGDGRSGVFRLERAYYHDTYGHYAANAGTARLEFPSGFVNSAELRDTDTLEWYDNRLTPASREGASKVAAKRVPGFHAPSALGDLRLIEALCRACAGDGTARPSPEAPVMVLVRAADSRKDYLPPACAAGDPAWRYDLGTTVALLAGFPANAPPTLVCVSEILLQTGTYPGALGLNSTPTSSGTGPLGSMRALSVYWAVRAFSGSRPAITKTLRTNPPRSVVPRFDDVYTLPLEPLAAWLTKELAKRP